MLISPVRIKSIVTRIASINIEHVGCRMLFAPALPRRERARYSGQLLPRHRARQCLTFELRPQALRVLIVEHEVTLVEFARHAEGQSLAANRAVVDGGVLDQRTEGYRKRGARDRIVDHFMPIENLDRIGTRLPLDGKADYLVVRIEKRGVRGRDEPWLQDSRNCVFLRAGIADLIGRHDVMAKVEAGEDRIGCYRGCYRQRADARSAAQALPSPVSHSI